MFMTPVEFESILGTTVFDLEVHPGIINYQLPTPCTTVQQQTEQKYEHTEKIYAFKMERTLDKKIKGHVFS